MTDSHVAQVEPTQEAPKNEADAVRAGALLRAAREAAGVHIATLAGTLKVPLDKLQALENGDLAALPDMVFARALASSVCRSLKIDPAPVLALLPRAAPGPLPEQSAGINTPVKHMAGKSLDFSPSHGKHRWLGWLVLALLLGALALLFWPHGAPDRSTTEPSPVSAAAVGAAAATAPQPLEAQSALAPAPGPAVAQVVEAQTPAPAPASVASAAFAVAVETQRPSASATAAAPDGGGAAAASAAASSSPAPALAGSAAGTDLLLLRARSASWVQVRDAAGKVVQERTLQAGESLSVTGTPPLAVVLGRADAVEVFVRGQPFAPPAVSKGKVARFEVK